MRLDVNCYTLLPLPLPVVDPSPNIVRDFGVEEPQWLVYQVEKSLMICLTYCDIISACDGQTDRDRATV